MDSHFHINYGLWASNRKTRSVHFIYWKKIGDASVLKPSLYAELIGLGLFLVGIITIVIATIRFFIQEKPIESDEFIPYQIKKTKALKKENNG